MGEGPGHIARRLGACDAALSGARRSHGDRGCLRFGAAGLPPAGRPRRGFAPLRGIAGAADPARFVDFRERAKLNHLPSRWARFKARCGVPSAAYFLSRRHGAPGRPGFMATTSRGKRIMRKGPSSTLEWRVEETCLNAWPALREVLLDGWLLRFSAGLTRRANSANALTGAAQAHPDECEPLYHRLGQPTIFRVLTLLDPSVDEELGTPWLHQRGRKLRPLRQPRRCRSGRRSGSEAARRSRAREWFAAMAALQGHSAEQARTYRSIVGQLAIPAAFAMLSTQRARPWRSPMARCIAACSVSNR